MIPGLLHMISTVDSKTVQEYAAINPQSLESTKCDEFLDFSYGHAVVIWPVGLL